MLLTRDNLPADDFRYRSARRPAVPAEPGADRRSPQGRRRHHDFGRRRQDGADAGGPRQGRRAGPPHHRRRALQRSRRQGLAAGARHRDHQLRPARRGRHQGAAESPEHRLHGRPQVRRRGRSVADLGDERACPGAGGAGLCRRRGSSRSRPAASIRFVPVDGKGADEDMAPNPPGEYAQSCVGRERMFEYFSRKHATPGRLFRLNYAIDMRYGVLHDIASKVLAGQADRRQPRPCQFHLAGRRVVAGAALPGALRHADLADQCQRPRDSRGARPRRKIRPAFWPRARHRRQGRADGVAHQHLAGRRNCSACRSSIPSS